MSKILFSVLPICCVLLFQPPAWAQVTGNHPCVGPCVLTFHYDLARDGVNGSETLLTPSAIKPAGAFGKVAAINGLRGEIYAQPLYMSGLNIGQAIEKAATMKFGAPAREFIEFVANAKKRGVCPLKRGAGEEMSL